MKNRAFIPRPVGWRLLRKLQLSKRWGNKLRLYDLKKVWPIKDKRRMGVPSRVKFYCEYPYGYPYFHHRDDGWDI